VLGSAGSHRGVRAELDHAARVYVVRVEVDADAVVFREATALALGSGAGERKVVLQRRVGLELAALPPEQVASVRLARIVSAGPHCRTGQSQTRLGVTVASYARTIGQKASTLCRQRHSTCGAHGKKSWEGRGPRPCRATPLTRDRSWTGQGNCTRQRSCKQCRRPRSTPRCTGTHRSPECSSTRHWHYR
jgi:hypothetical protein